MKNVSATVDDETHRRLRILYCPSRAASGETETQQHQLVLREPKEESKRRRIGISMPTTCPRKGCTSAMRLADSDTPLYVRQCLPVRRQQERSGHRGPSRQGRPHPLRPSARRFLLPSYKNVPGEQADPRVHRDTQVNTLTARRLWRSSSGPRKSAIVSSYLTGTKRCKLRKGPGAAMPFLPRALATNRATAVSGS